MTFFDKLAGNIDSKVIYQSMIVSCGKTYSKEIVKSGFSIKNVANREEYHHLTSLKGFSSKVILELEKEAPKILHILALRNVVDDVPKRIVGSFCITQARFDDAQIDRLKRLGWVEDTSVKKTTTVLITSDIDNVTGKVEKARKYGVDVMEIAQFFEQYIDDAEEVE
jgi:NAD-dependent DNA ligase